MEGHLALIAVAEVGPHIGWPHVGFGKNQPVLIFAVHDRAYLLDLDVRLRNVLTAGAVPLDKVRNRIEPQPIHAHIHPETHGIEHLFHHPWVIKIEIRLMPEEAVPIVLLRNVVPGPVRLFGVGEDDADAVIHLVRVTPHIHFALGRILWRMPRRLEPRVLIRGVIDDKFNHHLHVAGVGCIQKFLKIADRPITRVDVCVIRNVIPVITQWRREKRQDPKAGNAKILQIVQLGDEPLEVADTVTIGVCKCAHMQFIDDRVLIPKRIGGAAGFLHSC